MPSNARCGHTHYDQGHCSQPDCPNDIRRCQGCSQPSAPPSWSARPADEDTEAEWWKP